MKYQKPLGIGVLILSAGIFVFSACRLAAYVMENQAQEVALRIWENGWAHRRRLPHFLPQIKQRFL